MRIVHIGPSALDVLSERGGAVQRRMRALASEQAQAGHEVTVLSPSDQGEIVERDGYRVVRMGLRSSRPWRDYEFFLRARRVLRNSRHDVLHAHGSPEAARWLRGVADVSVQSVDFFRYRLSQQRLGHLYMTRALSRFDAIMPVSEFCSRTFKEYYPGLRTKVIVVPNGVDLEQFESDGQEAQRAREEYELGDLRLVIYLGRVCAQKGSDLLGPLKRELVRRSVDVSVLAAGPPEQFGADRVSPLMGSLGAQGVRCLGAVPEGDVAALLSAASVVVLPTREDEMFGMAALEALACGKPVVASDLGGIPEAVGDCGHLFPPGDVPAFARAVIDSLESGPRPGAARTHAFRFAWDEIADQTEAVYRAAMT